MHQPVDELFDDELPKRNARGFLIDKDGIPLNDAICEECKEPVPSPSLKFIFGKNRCSCCRHYWKAILTPKPDLKSALARARRARLPATLTDAQWQETLEHFKHVCAYCGLNPWLCVEHATPLPPGGTTVDNCLPSCRMCNAVKQGKTPEEMAEGPSSPWDPQKWSPAISWLRSKGRPVLTADQARALLSDFRAEVDRNKPPEPAMISFRTRTVTAMQIMLKALAQDGHFAAFAGRKRKTVRTSADAKTLRAVAKQAGVCIDW